jgi:hypothetical protein
MRVIRSGVSKRRVAVAVAHPDRGPWPASGSQRNVSTTSNSSFPGPLLAQAGCMCGASSSTLHGTRSGTGFALQGGVHRPPQFDGLIVAPRSRPPAGGTRQCICLAGELPGRPPQSHFSHELTAQPTIVLIHHDFQLLLRPRGIQAPDAATRRAMTAYVSGSARSSSTVTGQV